MAYNVSSFGSGAGAAASPSAATAQGLLRTPTGPTRAPAPAQPPPSQTGSFGTPTPPPPASAPPNALSGLQGLAGLVPPANAPLPGGSTDPAYLAYVRQLEYQRSVSQQAAQRQLANLQGQMVIGPEQLAAQGVISRRNISGAAESRGVFRSGERLQNLADERTQEAQRLAALRLAGAGQYGNIISTLQQNLGGIANTGAEQALADEARNALTGAA